LPEHWQTAVILRRLELALQLLQAQLQLALGALAADRQRPVLRCNLRDGGEVIAHEEGAVLRDRRAEVLDRRLEIRRTEGLPDERQLARQGEQALLGERAIRDLRQAELGGAADRRREGARDRAQRERAAREGNATPRFIHTVLLLSPCR
jgi:hypothetical protein